MELRVLQLLASASVGIITGVLDAIAVLMAYAIGSIGFENLDTSKIPLLMLFYSVVLLGNYYFFATDFKPRKESST